MLGGNQGKKIVYLGLRWKSFFGLLRGLKGIGGDLYPRRRRLVGKQWVQDLRRPIKAETWWCKRPKS